MSLPQTVFRTHLCRLLLVLVMFGGVNRAEAVGSWQPLARTAPGSISLMLLLSDGTVMAANSGTSSAWYQLTPDRNGSYVNGTWSTLASMHDTRLYYSSDVLTDGRVFVAGGEYGTGKKNAEVYDPLTDTWTLTPSSGQTFSDSISKMLPNGNVLVAPVGPSSSGGTSIYNPVSNTWLAGPKLFRGSYQDEASWVKLPDDSILTVDPFGTNSERYIPSLNKWIGDSQLPQTVYDPYGSELGAAFLLPNGNTFYLGSIGHTVTYTPSGSTNPGVWSVSADIPDAKGTPDAGAAMMFNGKILCAVSPIPVSSNHFPTPTSFYEYDYVSDSFTSVTGPTGATDNVPSFYTEMLDLPDGSVLFSQFGNQVYVYHPDGSPLPEGKPAINNITTNLDGSYHLEGTGLNGISEGAAYGDDAQMDSNYPIVRMTDTNGTVFYARTFNWSSTSVMTSNRTITTEFALPKGLLGGTYSLVTVANGNSSDPVSIDAPATRLPAVKNLGFTSKAPTNMVIHWNDIGFYETGYRIERSVNGTNFSSVATLGSNVVSYSNVLTTLGQYYFRVVATNLEGGDGIVSPVILAASPASTAVALPAFWVTQDLGTVGGSGAAGMSSGVFTVIGSGSGIGGTADGCRFAGQPISGDVTITARVTTNQNRTVNALAGVMIRSGLSSGAANVSLSFGPNNQNVTFQSRLIDDASSTAIAGPGSLITPYWVRLVRWGNVLTGYRSPDGVTWTKQGSVTLPLPAVVYAGLAVTSGTNTLLNTALFDSVTILRTASPQLTVFLNGPNPLTNECHFAYVDPGLSLRAMPQRIAAGGSNSLALKADGMVMEWGNSTFNQTNIPANATGVVAIAAGPTHALALKVNGTLIGWGDNSSGQSAIPSGLTTIVSMAAGHYYNLALRSNGTVIGWGKNTSGQTNIPSSATSVMAVAAGGSNSLALKTDGSVVSWGDNTFGQTNVPVSVSNVVAIAAGASHSLALRDDGRVIGWGNNTFSQTNIPSTATGVVAIVAGPFHNLALRVDGRVIGWGRNTSGETTVPATAISNIVAIAAGESHSLALRNDGAIISWGANGSGQLTLPASPSVLKLTVAVNGAVATNTLGSYFLSYTFTNAFGVGGTADRTVVVADTLAPALALNGANPLLLPIGIPFIDPGATALDACAGDLTGGIAASGIVDTNTPDTYTWTYTIDDGNGNSATNTRIVMVYGRPEFNPSSISADGSVPLQFTGAAGVPFYVYASTNLADWLLLGPATNIGSNVFQFTDPDATNFWQRYYQVRDR